MIDVGVNEAGAQYVVEANLKDRDSISFVKITQTTNVYQTGGIPQVSGANVLVTDNMGGSYSFLESTTEAGLYKNYDFNVLPNREYYLSVSVGESVITASATSRTQPSIDSVGYDFFEFGGQEVNLVKYHSVDKLGEQNHYRLIYWENGEIEETYYLGDDEFIEGQYYNAQFFGTSPDLGDSVFIEILEMDEAMYDYYQGLADEMDNSMFSAAPSNPPTNLQGGGALGYFGVFMTDTASLILQ
ncbi:MAG: hypothetical protein BM555_04940 [Crocinitomix sp. MedPE-SWsnd]|nr:MAG: hypothetical protein BM555_04940 [Crocinitomix sp. MedPE-SWsnd]